MNDQHLILIDGYGFVFRAYHSLPPLTREDGVEVGAVYGFSNMLWKVKHDMKATHMAVVFDAGSKTFRHDLYDAYKANRPPPPDTLVPQFPLVREAAEAMGLPVFEKQGFEADDVIATLAREAENEGFSVTIISSDKDLMQLVNDNIHMYDSMKSKHIDAKAVLEKFDVPPHQVRDYLAMVGDSSDNVPGVPGIGAKTAAILLKEYGTLENIIAHASELPKPKQRENFVTYADQARLSQELVTLKDDVDVNGDLSKLHVQETHHETWSSFLKQQGFKSLLAREEVQQKKAPSPSKQTLEYSLDYITDLHALGQWCAETMTTPYICVHSLPISPKEDRLGALALLPANGKGCWFRVSSEHEGLFSSGGLNAKQIAATLASLWEYPSILKIGYDIKRLYHQDSITHITPMDDILIMSYDCYAGLHDHQLETLCTRYLDENLPPYESIYGSGRQTQTIIEANEAEIHARLFAEVKAIHQLHMHLKRHLFQEHLMTIYHEIDRPLIDVLYGMECEGIAIDANHLRQLSQQFSVQIQELEKETYVLAGEEFNIGSPKQLAHILFEKLGMTPGGKTSKNKVFSTNAETLEELSLQGHTIAEKILEWRQFSKLKSTYTDALVDQINPITQRVHTTFNLHVASTGRLSSTHPNLQNIPIRTKAGAEIRKAFIARPDHCLISADYSQIELRILAHLANIESLKDAFKQDIDIHTKTASEVFGIPVDEIDSATRRRAKAINFGIIYGISAFGLAKQLSIERSEASHYIERYFQQYPGIRTFMEASKELAKKHGFVRTIFGRICHIPDIRDKNPARRSFGERVAINAPIQGSAADIIKMAMIKLQKALIEENIRGKMLLQVHDELLIEVHEADAEKAAIIVKQIMENIVQLSVPTHAHVAIGKSWADIH